MATITPDRAAALVYLRGKRQQYSATRTDYPDPLSRGLANLGIVEALVAPALTNFMGAHPGAVQFGSWYQRLLNLDQLFVQKPGQLMLHIQGGDFCSSEARPVTATTLQAMWGNRNARLVIMPFCGLTPVGVVDRYIKAVLARP